MLRTLFNSLNKYGFLLTAKKLCSQLSPKAVADFYLFLKGITSNEYAYTGLELVQIDLTDNRSYTSL